MSSSQKFSIQRKASNSKMSAAHSSVGNRAASLVDNRAKFVVQRKQVAAGGYKHTRQIVQRVASNTGLPDHLKSGIENLSGISMSDVKVHYNSPKPAQLQAHAYAQGSEIHIASGQEKHLPHEAWHVVQQKQGRVRPTMQMKGKVNVNDDFSLEKEADVMGRKALQVVTQRKVKNSIEEYSTGYNSNNNIVQRVATIPVNQQVSQTLIDPGQSVGKKYDWQSSFIIYLYNEPSEKPHVQVQIHIATPASSSVFAAWNKSVGDAWNYKFAIKSGAKSYPITVEIIKAASGEFKNYDVENVKQDVSHGVRGLFGTESMTKWGESDSQDIPHEVGHMLGNKDEYGTVDGTDWGAAHSDLHSDTHTIMFKGSEPPRLRHFNLILEEVKKTG
ncbi:MAG TPA: DUF4157 domain-containing protein, partial [Bacteroidia bacterium]|nr:DUF4157 domain-containing protein [Bacteroidia bacterium]